MNSPKDIGFHNVGQSLTDFRVRVDGKEIGPVLTFQQAAEECARLQRLHGLETWEDHFKEVMPSESLDKDNTNNRICLTLVLRRVRVTQSGRARSTMVTECKAQGVLPAGS